MEMSAEHASWHNQSEEHDLRISWSHTWYAASLIRQDRTLPWNIWCLVTVNPKKAPPLTKSYVVGQSGGICDYITRRADGSNLIGEAKATMLKDRRVWYIETDNSELIEPTKHYFDGFMQRYFLGWEDNGAYLNKMWTCCK